VGDVHSLGPFYGRITESGAAADVTVTTSVSRPNGAPLRLFFLPPFPTLAGPLSSVPSARRVLSPLGSSDPATGVSAISSRWASGKQRADPDEASRGRDRVARPRIGRICVGPSGIRKLITRARIVA